jgi:pimeloyl-ACP methyl ester carboxylesterase
MWRWTKRALIGLGGLLVVTPLIGATYQWFATRHDLAGSPPPGRLLDVGGHRLHLWCMGSGSPAVILENGLGGSSAAWGFVQADVAGFTQVCSYDHAGMGYSDPGPSPRTTRRIVHELARLLDVGGIQGPVVLVGASLGGFTVRLFASEYAPRAAGLVLVDASHEDQEIDVPRMAPLMPLLAATGVLRLAGMSLGLDPASLAPPVRGFARATRFRTAGYRAAVDEFVHARESAAEVKATRRPLTIPLVVVTAGRGADAAWRALQADQVGLSRRGCQVVAEESGHVVAVDQPQVVVEAIRATVSAARGNDDVGLCASPGGRTDSSRPH